MECDGALISAREVHSRTVRGAGAVATGCDRTGVRRECTYVWGAEPPTESIGASTDRARCGPRGASGPVRGTLGADGDRATGNLEGRRCLCAAGSEPSAETADLRGARQWAC